MAPPSRRLFAILCFAALPACLALIAPTPAPAAEEAPASAPSDERAEGYRTRVLPVLTRYCNDCHSGEKPKAGLDLSAFTDAASVAEKPDTWLGILEQLEAQMMPPDGKPQPAEAELAAMSRWIEEELERDEGGGATDPRRVTVRRLNRAEYTNTIRDLVGVEFLAADDFPSDDVGYGFDNIGNVLSMPPILLEKYLAAAESIASTAIVAEVPSEGSAQAWEAEELGGSGGGKRYKDLGRILTSPGEITSRATLPIEGRYAIRVKAFRTDPDTGPLRMAIRVDGETLRTVEVTAEEKSPGTYETEFAAKAGVRSLSFVLLDKPIDEEKVKDRRRGLVVDAIEVRGPIVRHAGDLPESHRRLFAPGGAHDDPREAARAILGDFARRAYRRPVAPEEVERLLGLFDLAVEDGDRFEEGIRLAVQAILVSPRFLFRIEEGRAEGTGGEAEAGPGPVDDYELATRLSYFLWSSMPDRALFELARRGTLHLPGVLEAQTRRMLADPKAKALVENFAGQWLQTRNLKTLSPDRRRFPSFDEPLRAAMLRESELFFRAVLDEDRSVLDLLDADYTFVNERLAKHYGIEGVAGDEFRKVSLTGGRRGGILTQAATLTITSNPTRTSPVKRGKWILEQVLGTPPPPPPPGVPELPDRRKDALSGTLRQRLEQHRANPDCASCHNRMDPLGFGFENYDAIGAWRDEDADRPIDPSGELPGGTKFAGPAELKAILRAKDREFARCLAGKMLTYALGRGLAAPDRRAVDRIVEELAGADYRSSALVLGIVRSDPFLTRGGTGNGGG